MQLGFFKKQERAYGGTLLRTRKGRSGPRPLATRSSMHLVLRSSRATGKQSFRRKENAQKIQALTKKFASKFGVKIISSANVGNHLHFHLKLGNRQTYKPFIRGLTAAIAMAISGTSRWKKATEKFWDYRPFTRIVEGFRAYLSLQDYIRVNQYETIGSSRAEIRFALAWERAGDG